MKVPLFIIVLMTIVIIVIPVLADDCGCSDTGDGASDTGSDGSGGGESSGDNTMILVTEGRILFAEGRYNESLAAYRDALTIDPNDASAWSGTGDSLYASGNYADAVDAYDHLIRLDPADDAAWYRKGNALLAAGAYQDAAGAYDRALAMNPGIAKAEANREIARAKIEAAGSPREIDTSIPLTSVATPVSITHMTSDPPSVSESPTSTMRSGNLPVSVLAAFCIICSLRMMLSSSRR
jgi:hypothetical protein